MRNVLRIADALDIDPGALVTGLPIPLPARRDSRVVVDMDMSRVQRVLSGDQVYDTLTEEEQALVRAEWDRRITERREHLNLEAAFIAEGRDSWAIADEHGNVHICHPTRG